MHRRYIVYRDLKPANILLDENGHVRISDLGLACDFSKKKPHASVGTHGYMAPEVLSKGTPYDSSADWFSFGCMLYKLLKGHSPFRQHKTKDKHEIDRMTLTMVSFRVLVVSFHPSHITIYCSCIFWRSFWSSSCFFFFFPRISHGTVPQYLLLFYIIYFRNTVAVWRIVKY